MRTEHVTTLKRQATELLAGIERDKQPILITQHGQPSAYLVDAGTFELLQQRVIMLEGIVRGALAMAEGRGGITRGGQDPHGAMAEMIWAKPVADL